MIPTEVFRHEWKYPLLPSVIPSLSEKLSSVLKTDPFALDGKYFIRSLYFDNCYDKALMEKSLGQYERYKYRIRMYNGDDSFLKLEKKMKTDYLTKKFSTRITKEEYEHIVQGDVSWMLYDDRPLLHDFYFRYVTDLLRPKTLVQYTRFPYEFDVGNVRITLDTDIVTGLSDTDLFSDNAFIPVRTPSVLEVKYDHFLPDFISSMLSEYTHERISASKYAYCRIYD